MLYIFTVKNKVYLWYDDLLFVLYLLISHEAGGKNAKMHKFGVSMFIAFSVFFF